MGPIGLRVIVHCLSLGLSEIIQLTDNSIVNHNIYSAYLLSNWITPIYVPIVGCWSLFPYSKLFSLKNCNN